MANTSTRPRTAAKLRPLAVVGLVLVAINLRPAVTSLGPVLEEVRASLGMSAAVAGLLTSVPAVCFALVGSLAPLLARRWGTGGVIALGTAALALGLAVRPFAGGTGSFIALTALALAGIALANVLLPVVVKQRFPTRVGAMTGLYSVALNLGASTAAAVTVPLTAGAFGGDWRLGLGVWAVVAAAALPTWILLARDRTTQPTPAASSPDVAAESSPDVAAAAGPDRAAVASLDRAAEKSGPGGQGAGAARVGLRLRRQPIAWALAVYFGLQSTAAYVIMGWLPQIFRDAGLSARTAGLLFAVTALLGVPLSFALSALAGRLPRQSGVAVLIGLFGLGGYLGLWVDPAAAPWLWVVLLGVGNCSFPLVLTMIALRGRDAATVARLSAFAQSSGYLLSVPGPIVVGVLYEHTGSWRIPLALLAVLMVPQMVAGVLAGRDRQIG
ncbi:MFS transporter [Actinoplanes sp. ATCC 53533]|uniref:MFS transporter n=1 Tax=Actinoplanes sp. ATCC 53533 TaxID=1288362 RepID=UPI000F7AEB90|nr:MFS transporter [Actinoplanes sp. ATCC 53533]RSM58609.1 MFS transporter [Actinoplanes sp. ATCC 53533]